jgi:hypothetical protein
MQIASNYPRSEFSQVSLLDTRSLFITLLMTLAWSDAFTLQGIQKIAFLPLKQNPKILQGLPCLYTVIRQIIVTLSLLRPLREGQILPQKEIASPRKYNRLVT